MKSNSESVLVNCSVISLDYEKGGGITTTIKGRRNQFFPEPRKVDLTLLDKKTQEEIILSISKELFDLGFERITEKRLNALQKTLPKKINISRDTNGNASVSMIDMEIWIKAAKNLLK